MFNNNNDKNLALTHTQLFFLVLHFLAIIAEGGLHQLAFFNQRLIVAFQQAYRFLHILNCGQQEIIRKKMRINLPFKRVMET